MTKLINDFYTAFKNLDGEGMAACYHDDIIFEDLWDEPRFVALQKELDPILAEEHEKVLQLICFNNPVPDDWQPMPETCEGVVEQRRL